MPNPSYRKGYRLENEMRKALSKFGSCERSHQSGAYTGECDLRWLRRFRFWRIDCKSRAKGFKRDYDRLEKADILIDKADGEIPIVKMLLPKWLELINEGDE